MFKGYFTVSQLGTS